MKEWVYDGHELSDYSNEDVVMEMLNDPDNQEVQDEFFTWFEEFGNNYPDTTLFTFIMEHNDGICKVSDMVDELRDMFVEYLADNEDLMAYCGAERRDLDAEREDWEADNRD